MFLTYLGRLYRPVRGAGRLSATVSAARASAERLIELLEQQPTVREPAHPRPLPPTQWDTAQRGSVHGRVHGRDTVQRGVVFTNVGFRYPGAVRPTLAEISFTLAPGQKVALVGASGAGKSTDATHRVLAPMRRLMAERTTLIISYNLLTVTDADQSLYLHGGPITGAGTHQDLLATHPGYAQLHRLHEEPDTPTSTRHRLQPELI